MYKTLCGFVLLFFFGAIAVSAQNSVYDLKTKPQKATVSILALSASVHAGSGSHQIYLADVSLKNDPHRLAKLVDNAYGGLPILRSILVERRLLKMTLIRNPDCDTTGRNFFLQRDDTNIFDTATRTSLEEHAADTIPCFNVVHQDTRLAKVK